MHLVMSKFLMEPIKNHHFSLRKSRDITISHDEATSILMDGNFILSNSRGRYFARKEHAS